MEEGWICEGWLCQEGELLLHLRERQDKRQLLGGKSRVLQDQVRVEKVSLGDTKQRHRYQDQEEPFKMSSAKSS